MDDNLPETKAESSANKYSFNNEINTYIKHLDALADIVPLMMNLVQVKMIQENAHINDYIKDKKIKEEKNNEATKKLFIPVDDFKGFVELNEKLKASKIAYKFLPINFVVSFVSQYDAYLGRLIRTIFTVKPQILNSSERNILFTELLLFKDIDEAKDFVIEKEVESVLRESHLKQFKWIEGKLSLKLREDLPSFKNFIEITERRNLFVHSNGTVSRQYLENCKEQNVEGLDKIILGQILEADPKYFGKCYNVLFEIGVKLGHVIWRKLEPEQLEKADSHLNDVCFDLLVKGRYKLAINLLSFATETIKKHHDQQMLCIFNINKSLAYYLSGKKEDAIKILKKNDWSATGDKFKLAISILHEEYEDALSIMKTLGPNSSEVGKNQYREWPLFKEFRKTDRFKEVYKDIFGEEFVYIEIKPKKLKDIITDIEKEDEISPVA